MTRILLLSFSHLGRDPRVDRQVEMLRADHELVTAGWPPAPEGVTFVDLTMPPRSPAGRAAGFARLLARRYDEVYWTHPHNRRARELLADVRCDLVIANDLPALPLALSLPGSPPVVFDAHEYAPGEQAERMAWRMLMSPYMRELCRRYLPRVAGMMTVSPGIADLYSREFGVDVSVVTNAPRHRADLAPTPVSTPIRLLYHGVAQRGRDLGLTLEAFAQLEPRFTFDLVLAEGDPGVRDELAARAERLDGAQVLPPRPMHELVERANAYDVGVFLLPPRSPNLRFAAPNKFFEFIQARLALAIGPSPDMASIVRSWGNGVVADAFTPASLGRALNSLSPEAVAAMKARSHAAAPELSADRNREIVLGLVDRALR